MWAIQKTQHKLGHVFVPKKVTHYACILWDMAYQTIEGFFLNSLANDYTHKPILDRMALIDVTKVN